MFAFHFLSSGHKDVQSCRPAMEMLKSSAREAPDAGPIAAPDEDAAPVQLDLRLLPQGGQRA